jgi:anti-sigma regulatory factor (Ser/Thr protein kinase)
VTAPKNETLFSSVTLAALPTAVRLSRLMTAKAMRLWGLPGLIDDAGLVVSELVTNAVQATGTTEPKPSWEQLGPVAAIKVRVTHLGGSISIAVWDNDPTPPASRDAAPDAEGGRGLMIVAALSERWDYYPSAGGGKVVWAELAIPPGMLGAAGLPRRVRSAPVATVSRGDFIRDPGLLRRVHQGLKDL